jgi:hypothetical protein
LIKKYEIGSENDYKMYKSLLDLSENGGFLIKEEKIICINYFIWLYYIKNGDQNILNGFRECSSIMNLWQKKNGSRKNYHTNEFRTEQLILMVHEYEVLGNEFLRKQGYTKEYYRYELGNNLKKEKCKLKEEKYEELRTFFEMYDMKISKDSVNKINVDKEFLDNLRKLIWKIREGIEKYS